MIVDPDNEEAGSRAAKELRARYLLGIAPIENVASFAEEHMGFDVLISPMPAGIDAMTARDPERDRTIIAVATTENAERQRFSIAHEIGHAVFDDLVAGTIPHPTDPKVEDRAHCFARHFLIPVEGLERRLGELNASHHRITEAHVSALVQHFGVSATVAALQLRQAGWVGDDECARLSALEAKRLAALYGWDAERRARVMSSHEPRTPQRLAARATQAYAAGLIPLQALTAVRGDATRAETQSWLDEAGIVVEPKTCEHRRPAGGDDI